MNENKQKEEQIMFACLGIINYPEFSQNFSKGSSGVKD